MLTVWGFLISFCSVLVFFFSSFAFPGDLFSDFPRKNWGHFAVAYLVADSSVLARSSAVLSRFSICLASTRPLLNNRSADLLPAPPFSGDSVAVSAVASGLFDFASRWQ